MEERLTCLFALLDKVLHPIRVHKHCYAPASSPGFVGLQVVLKLLHAVRMQKLRHALLCHLVLPHL